MSKMKNSFLKFLKHLQPLFTLPNSIEESQKQTEVLLTLYIWSITTLFTVVCVSLSIFTPQNGPRFLTIAALFDALHLFFYFLIKRGFVRQANILTVWVTWLLLTGIAVTGGGLRGPIFPGYFLLTFLAGITLGGRQMGLFAVLSAMTGFGMAYLEKNGILPNPQYVYLPFRYWSIQSANLLMLVLLQYYASWIVRHTLQKLNNELKERKEIEKSLSASQRRFAAIFENSPIPTAIATIDDLRWIDVNTMFVELCGYTRQELIGRNKEETKIWKNAETLEQMLTLTHEHGEVRNLETSLWRKDDEIRYVSVTIGKLNLDETDRLIFQVLDITEKHQLAKSLFESNQRFEQLATHIEEVFWISEKTGKINYASPACDSLFGCSAEDLYLGRKEFIDLVHPEDRQIVFDSFESDLRGENSVVEYRIVHPDGEIRWVSDRSYPILGKQGELLRTVGITADITEQKMLEAERREMTSTLEDAEQQAGLGSWSHDLLTNQDKWSQQMFTLFGIDPTEGIPTIPAFLEHIHPEDREMLGNVLFKMMHGEETTTLFTYRTNPERGEMRVLKPTYRVEKDANERITKFIGTVLDITERKRAEAELEYLQKLLEKVIHAGKNITSITDLDTCLREIHQNITVNLGFERVGLFLYDAEKNAIQGTYGTDRNGQRVKNDWFLEIVNDQSDWQVALQNPNGIKVTTDYEKEYPSSPNNEMRGVKQHIMLAAWAGDAPVALIAVDNLITKKPITPADIEAIQLFAGYAGLAIQNARLHSGLEALVEERTMALRKSEKSLQLFLDTANDLIQSLDESGHYIYVNQSWCRTLGYTFEEAESLNMLQVVDKEYHEHCMKIFEGFMKDGKSQILEVGFRTKSGSLVIVEGSISIQVRNDGKRVTNGFFRDITGRKQAEIAMRKANLEMEQALRMKDEFLANMSHELRTPLNAVLGLSESLLEETIGPINQRQEKYLQTINESGKHLLELINEILDLAKIESGKIQLNIHKVDIHKICEATLQIVEHLAKKKSQKIHLEIDDKVRFIQADERRLKQMIVNLLSNGIKFTQEGGEIGIKVYSEPALNVVNIQVWDTGIGIPQSDLARIFQPFIQLNSGLAREASGTGLGLTLVEQMARLHGGSITVNSQSGKGSSFTISLPNSQDIRTVNVNDL